MDWISYENESNCASLHSIVKEANTQEVLSSGLDEGVVADAAGTSIPRPTRKRKVIAKAGKINSKTTRKIKKSKESP